MPFTHRLVVRFGDCDLYAHVNNAVYLTYFEEARGYFWRALQGEAFTGFGFIIAENVVTYLAPAKVGDALAIDVRVTRIGSKSWDLGYEIREEASGKAIARGRSVQVMYDHAAEATVPMSDADRARLVRAQASDANGA